MNKTRTNQGFTLIELMVVVIIIAALAGMVLPRLIPQSDIALSKVARGEMANISVGLKLYRLHNGSYPSSLKTQPARVRTSNGHRMIPGSLPTDIVSRASRPCRPTNSGRSEPTRKTAPPTMFRIGIEAGAISPGPSMLSDHGNMGAAEGVSQCPVERP